MPDLWGSPSPASVTGVSPTQQAGQARRQRWSFAEPAVWTDRMLKTLEEGIEGGRWFRLIDKVWAERTLRSAFAGVWRNDGSAGVDAQNVRDFERHLEKELAELSQELREGRYRPLAVKRVFIPKPGSAEMRPLGVPAVRDRVVQGALKAVLEPILEREFAEQSYGFRPGRGCKDALRRVDELLKSGCAHVVDADIKSYFDLIPHAALMEKLAEHVADGRVLALTESFLKAGVLEEMKEWTPESGTPQGGVISPLLANLYLNALDHEMVQAGWQMVRYADDFVILCRSAEEAQAALAQVQKWMETAGLMLHPQKTRVVDMKEPGGFEFLGYHFDHRGRRWPRRKSLIKLRERVRELTPRRNGHSLEKVIRGVNPVLRGWFGYFQHSGVNALREVDKWVRMRLRSILRKRQRKRGRGRGSDHQRWPNQYFAEHGLFSLAAAHAQFFQPR